MYDGGRRYVIRHSGGQVKTIIVDYGVNDFIGSDAACLLRSVLCSVVGIMLDVALHIAPLV
jgi:hypothetical protein